VSKVYIEDAQGRKNPASWYIPQQVLEVITDSHTKYMLHELTQMEAQFAEEDYENVLFPRLGTVEPIASGFDYVAYKQRLKLGGQAEFLSRTATNFPTADNGMKPYISPVIPIGIAYTVGFFEQATAQRFGLSLDMQGMQDCAEHIDIKLEEAWHKGALNPDGLLIKGFFDYLNGGGATELAAGTSIYKSTLGTGQAGNTWALKTGLEILRDIETLIEDVTYNSKGAASVKKVLMGFASHKELGRKDIVTEDGRLLRMRPYLAETYPQIEFIPDSYLDLISFTGPTQETWDGGATTNAVIAYDDRPTHFKFRANRREIIRPYETSGGFQAVKVNTYGLTAGIQMRKTYGATYMKGV